MKIGNISASALLPAELREIARIKRRAERVSGLKILMRDPLLFERLGNILKGLEQDRYSGQLRDLETEVSQRISGGGSSRFNTDVTEIDEEYLADGSKVKVEKYDKCGVRVKYYDYVE